MTRKGRPRKNTPREPNGRARRGMTEKPTEEAIDMLAINIRAEKQAAAWGIGPIDKEGKSTTRDQKRGSFIGILRLVDQQKRGEGISEEQLQIATEIKKMHGDYLKAIQAPGAIYEPTGGPRAIPDDEAHARWCKATKDAWGRVVKTIRQLEIEHRNLLLMTIIDKCVLSENGHEWMIGDLRIVLNGLAREFSTDKKRAA